MKPVPSNGISTSAPCKGGKVLLLVLVCCFSCEDFLNIGEPKNQVVGQAAYKDDAAATSAIIGIYAEMMNKPAFASVSVTLRAGFSADELNSSVGNDFLGNSLQPSDATLKSLIWEPGYKYAYYANSLLEGISRSSSVSPYVKKRLEGEAKFIRAFAFFYLTNLFGDVPLITTTDYQINARFSRTPQAEVYAHILNDLEAAAAFLPDDYSLYGNERVRPNKAAATALLARVYLYMSNWTAAEAAATTVINSSLYSLQDDPNKVFLAKVDLAANREAIWQLQPTAITYTFEKLNFTFTGPASSNLLRNETVKAFEPSDKRKTQWTGCTFVEGQPYYYPLKYKADDKAAPEAKEYSMVLRLAEQYLIRAEARAQQGKLNEAIADVDVIRQRAGLPLIAQDNPGIEQTALLEAILHERRIEFIAEWGHRWLDLKRTNRADAALSTLKPDWQSTDVLYPIPQSEIDNNPNLNPQNEGY